MRSLFSYAVVCSCIIFLSCEKDSDSIIESRGSSPLLLAASVSPTTINTDTVSVGAEQKPDDVLILNVKTYATVIHSEGTSQVAAVTAIIFGASSSSPLAVGKLLNDGIDVDSTKQDNIFSGWVTFEIRRSEVGTYRVEVSAEDYYAFRSNTFIVPLEIIRTNRPPVLSNLQVPSAVSTATQTSFLITVQASDPDGLADIKSVTRTTPSGLTLQLNDAGVNGDAAAGDGIYSETVSLSPPPAPGSYQFRFQAFDRSNTGSNIILHTITITP